MNRRGVGCGRIAAAGLLVAALVAPALAQQETAEGPRLLAVGPGGQLDLQGERRLRIEGLVGSVGVRTARDEQVIFAARSLADRRTELDVELWVDDRDLILRPAETSAGERILLEIAVAPGMAVDVELSDGHLEVAGLYSNLAVRSVGSSIEARGVRGSVEARIEGGSLLVDGIEGDLDFEGTDVEAVVRRVPGSSRIDQSGGTLEVSSLSGDVDLRLTGVTVTGKSLHGRVQLDAENGSVGLVELHNGFEAYLRGCPLELGELRGLTRIESDRNVTVRGASSQLTVDSTGGDIRVSENNGPTELSGFGGNVVADKIGGPLQIRGTELQVVVSESRGNVVVETSASTVRVRQAQAPVRVTNDFGDVHVEGATGEVVIQSNNGDVFARDLESSVRILADGPQVEVAWKTMPQEGECLVRNENGTVRLEFPLRATGQIRAESSYGRITSSVGGVRVADDERRAVGLMGGKNVPSIEVEAAGDLELAPMQTGNRAQ